MIQSCVYEGTIRHRRHVPVNHEFQYRVFMMYVDLDEVSTVFDKHWFWSSKRPNLAWFRRADYLDQQTDSLSESVRQLVHSRLGVVPDGPIRLLTHFRYFGYSINPISIYYCFNNREEVEYVVAEVTNTPWREKHAYVLDARHTNSKEMEFVARKELHVSPFLEMDYEYRFRISKPVEKLSVEIQNHRLVAQNEITPERQNPAFAATLTMQRRPLTSVNLARVLCRYPLMTTQVFSMIRWQAFRLWAKKLAIQRHPKVLSGKVESKPDSIANNRIEKPGLSTNPTPSKKALL